jgi:CheY-like chemotaxis protein
MFWSLTVYRPPERPSRQPRPSRSWRLIDDSRTAQATLGRGLEETGFEVLVAGDTVEALDHLAHRRCAVVLADYQLPWTNGLDFLAALRGAYPDAPLILYSASMTPELAAQARDFGVALIEKPVSPARLVEVVRTATTLDGRCPHRAAEP